MKGSRARMKVILGLLCLRCASSLAQQVTASTSDPAISYTGGWILTTGHGSHITNSQGEVATFTFTGTAVSLRSTRSASQSIERITLDGKAYSVDCSWPDRSVSGDVVVVWSATGLTRAKHTVIFTKTSSSDFSAVVWDFIYTPSGVDPTTPSKQPVIAPRPTTTRSRAPPTSSQTSSARPPPDPTTSPSTESTPPPDTTPAPSSIDSTPITDTSNSSPSTSGSIGTVPSLNISGVFSTGSSIITSNSSSDTAPTINTLTSDTAGLNTTQILQTINGQVITVIQTLDNGEDAKPGSDEGGLSSLTLGLAGAAAGFLVLLLALAFFLLWRRKKRRMQAGLQSGNLSSTGDYAGLITSSTATGFPLVASIPESASHYAASLHRASQASPFEVPGAFRSPRTLRDRPPTYISTHPSSNTHSTYPLFNSSESSPVDPALSAVFIDGLTAATLSNKEAKG